MAVAVMMVGCCLLTLSSAVTPRISVFSQTPPNPVLVGDTVTVLCNGTGSSLFWEVDNVPEPHFDGNIFRTNRFTDGAITTWSGTITVNATLAINNTLIECVVQGSSTNPDTQEVRIIIAGPPSAPATSLRDMSIGTVLRLSWMEPHTSDGYPVTSYTVLVFNHTSSTLLVNTTLNSSLHFYEYNKPNDSICETIELAILANSILGPSIVATEVGFFPIIPDVSSINITREVEFTESGQPRLTVGFRVPEVCPQQYPFNYTIEIVDDRGEAVTSTKVQAVQNNSDGLVMEVFESGLVTNKTLTVRVTFVSSAMSWSTSVTHDVIISDPPEITSDPPEITSDPPEDITGAQTEIENTKATSSGSDSIVIISVVAVGVLVLVCVIMIVFVALIFVWHKGRRPVITAAVDFSPAAVPTTSPVFKLSAPPKGKSKTPKTLPPMKDNPIYAGPLYDSPGGESLKQLLGNMSVPSTPASECPRYFGLPSPPPILPPPRKPAGQATDSSASSKETEVCDMYTEMKPTTRMCGISRPPDVLPAVYEAMRGEPLYDVSL